MPIDAIIFDFDGVVIDTETPDLELWQAAFRERGLDLSESMWSKRVGYNEDDAFDPARHYEKVTGTVLESTFFENHHKLYLERCASQPILPGVLEILREAPQRGIKLAVASSSYRSWVERWLRHHNLLDYFDCIRTRDDVKEGKPAPDLYLGAAECLGVPVERCLAIEDSPTGMRAALAAGIRCIAVPNTLTQRLERPDVALTLTSLADLDLQTLISQF